MGRWPRSVRDGSWIWLLAAVGLAYLFWQPLWHGAGLIGGDVYSYFLPQKTWYASRLDAGEFPLWNPLVGHGYPLLGESQTAAFSPFNLAAYRLFDVNTAYNVVQLAHYVLCFVFTWLLARRLELSRPAAGLAAIVFTFAWFPPRITLEWAITTGTWLPAAAWCVESYLVTRRLRYALGLSVVLALQMLAGHYNLAFITQVTLIVYTAARLLLAPRRTDFQSVHSAERPRSQTTGRTGSPSDGGTAASHVAPRLEGRQAGRPSPRVRATLVLGGALIAGFGLAAVQLAPSWELKQLSQRASVGRHHEPGELHIPVRAWSQLVVPWEWFTETEDPFPALLPAGAPKTNRTEAHLYFGLVPLALVAFAILGGLWWRDRRWRIWAVLGAGTLIYATGWLVPVTRHLPGFSFFLGPARFSLVTTLAAALLAAAALDCVLGRARRAAAFVLAVLVLTATAGDLLLVSEALRGKVYWILQTPGPELIDASPVRRVLAGADQPVRVFGRAANSTTMLGVAATPPYFGFGPAEYFDERLAIPEPMPFDVAPSAGQLAWMRRAGVTHLLSQQPLDAQAPVELLWRGRDPFLNLNVGNPRFGRELYLYALAGSRGRVAWQDAQPGDLARVTEYRANAVVIDATSADGGLLVLTDLAFPGWTVTIDGEPAEPVTFEGMFRGVVVPAGRHLVSWTFRPRPIYVGAALSTATLFALAYAALRAHRSPP